MNAVQHERAEPADRRRAPRGERSAVQPAQLPSRPPPQRELEQAAAEQHEHEIAGRSVAAATPRPREIHHPARAARRVARARRSKLGTSSERRRARPRRRPPRPHRLPRRAPRAAARCRGTATESSEDEHDGGHDEPEPADDRARTARRRGRRRRSRAASRRDRAAGRRRRSRPRTPGRPSSACGRPPGDAAGRCAPAARRIRSAPMRVHSRATVASGAVVGPGCSGGVSVTGSRRTLAEAARRMGEDAAARRQARRARAGEVRTSWARMPASATASSASRREHPGRPRVPEDAPRRRGDHAERCRRRTDRRERRGRASAPAVGELRLLTAAEASMRRNVPLVVLWSRAITCRCTCCCIGGAASTTPRGCWTRPGVERARCARAAASSLNRSGAGETTAGLGSGAMSACVAPTGSARVGPSSGSGTVRLRGSRLNDGRRVGRHASRRAIRQGRPARTAVT